MQEKFDAIIIGSGMGALTCASLLAQLYHKKVLIVERHFTVGGYTHMFSRNKIYEWDVGLHYVGEMYPGSRYRYLFDYITNGQVDWYGKTECYDKFIYPGLFFNAYAGIERFERDLVAQFPREKQAISEYLKDVADTARWFGRLMFSKLLPTSMQKVRHLITQRGSEMALMTTRDYLTKKFNDPRLIGVLASQWGNFGLPPHQSAFAIHALTVCHMLQGGYYPIGGAKSIADSIVPIIEAQGGKLLLRHKVEEIKIENNKATGVIATARHRGKTVTKTFHADMVISNTGVYVTYQHLIPESAGINIPGQFDAFPAGLSQVCLYLGLKESPQKFGFGGENHWIYDDFDHDTLYQHRNQTLDGKIRSCFISFPSLKNPDAEGHTAEMITFLDYQPFVQWSQNRWQKRGDEYDALKATITQGFIDLLDKHYPGFSSSIDYAELSTPLTISDFTGHHQGAVHGLPGVPEKFFADWVSPRTPIENLYITGADIAGHGIIGAFMSGFLTLMVACRNSVPIITLLSKAQIKSFFGLRF